MSCSKWCPRHWCEKSPQPGFHLGSCLNHNCIAIPISPAFFRSLPSPQLASYINSSTRLQVHLHFAATRPLKMMALIASNGLPHSKLSASAIRWAVLMLYVCGCCNICWLCGTLSSANQLSMQVETLVFFVVCYPSPQVTQLIWAKKK